MKLHRVFVERAVFGLPHTQKILSKLPQAPTIIEDYQSLFGSVRRPYLQKRESLHLFLAQKKGELVKPAPSAYGARGGTHYYYVHAYNCPYECSYCYLQGYFDSPDLVFFVNHHDILKRMEELSQGPGTVWFYGGEFSDSLALSHLTQELEDYASFFRGHPHCRWELRTKSVNLREIQNIPPGENLFVSFSLSPENAAKDYDLKAPPLRARLQAMAQLKSLGHRLAVHLDPIVYQDDLRAQYHGLLEKIHTAVGVGSLAYLSLGVVRFSERAFRAATSNYPKAPGLYRELARARDQKRKYPRAIRSWVFNQVYGACLDVGLAPEKVYRCMEDD